MKTVKILIALVLFCAMGYTGYTAHKKMSMSEAEKFMKTNVEALTLNEPGGGDFRYPQKSGKGVFCTLYVYMKGSIVVASSEEKQPNLEASGEYTKKTVSGLKDRCPNSGDGCNPYSCQEVPYK